MSTALDWNSFSPSEFHRVGPPFEQSRPTMCPPSAKEKAYWLVENAHALWAWQLTGDFWVNRKNGPYNLRNFGGQYEKIVLSPVG